MRLLAARSARGGARATGSGFTLVELMIVVAILAILAAIAIPAFSRYVKKSRTAEAPMHLNKLWSSSVAYWEADHANSLTNFVSKQFPSGPAVQEGDCCVGPGGKCGGSDPVYTGNGWLALNFSIRDPHHFRPAYTQSGVGTSSTFTVSANADLDCDGTQSTFLRAGSVNATSGDVQASGTMYMDQELE